MVSVWAIYEARSFPWRVFLCFIWNPPTHTSVHSTVSQKVLPCHLWEFLLLHSWALSHQNMWCVVGRAGHVTEPQGPSFPEFLLGQREKILLRYFLPVLSRALPKNQAKEPRRWGDDTAVVSKALPLLPQRTRHHLLEDEVKYWLDLREKFFGSGISSRSCRQWINRSSQDSLCLIIRLEQEQTKGDKGSWALPGRTMCPILADCEFHPTVAAFPSAVVCSGHTPFPQLPPGPCTDLTGNWSPIVWSTEDGIINK